VTDASTAPPDPQAAETKKTGPNTSTVTLKKLGAKLPLGILNGDGTYSGDIAVRPWRMKEERELGELRDSHRDGNVAQYVGMVLATMCTKLGPHNFEGMKFEERRIIVGQMYMGDVFYAYIWLRIQAMGHQLNMNLTCPNCERKFPFVADLESTEVIAADNLKDAKWEYKLHTPIKLRDTMVKSLLIGPARWNGL